jgi:hypothetical protein
VTRHHARHTRRHVTLHAPVSARPRDLHARSRSRRIKVQRRIAAPLVDGCCRAHRFALEADISRTDARMMTSPLAASAWRRTVRARHAYAHAPTPSSAPRSRTETAQHCVTCASIASVTCLIARLHHARPKVSQVHHNAHERHVPRLRAITCHVGHRTARAVLLMLLLSRQLCVLSATVPLRGDRVEKRRFCAQQHPQHVQAIRAQ